jgi:hypothetical protein
MVHHQVESLNLIHQRLTNGMPMKEKKGKHPWGDSGQLILLFIGYMEQLLTRCYFRSILVV